jgi:hypothetical protein
MKPPRPNTKNDDVEDLATRSIVAIERVLTEYNELWYAIDGFLKKKKTIGELRQIVRKRGF